MLARLMACCWLVSGLAQLPQYLWLEAESFAPLRGANFSFMPEARETRGAWSLAGPDTAPAWTQGGESEFMSIAARADEPGEISVGREIEAPAAGQYTLWVRYADCRGKQEAFGVRVRQGGRTAAHVFGRAPIVDELDPMKLLWDWAFAWDHTTVALEKGPARVEIYTTGPTEARREIDCLCLTTDPAYHPAGREKPAFATWAPLRSMQQAGMPAVEPLRRSGRTEAMPPAWKIASGPPVFLWNVGQPWWQELQKPAAARMEAPFGVDPPLLDGFLAAFRGKEPPVYGHLLSGPVWHIPLYPTVFANGSPFLDWLARHPPKKFALLLNYGEPGWPKGADRAAVHANLRRFQDRFLGYIAGENIAYGPLDNAALERRVRAARSRAEVRAALRELHTAATRAKFAGYYGAPVTDREAWEPVIPCLAAGA